MKISKYFALLFASLSLLASCEETPDNNTPEPPAEGELVLQADKTSVEVGSAVQFTATIDGEDVTAEATIYNATTSEVVANPYTTVAVGDIYFYAKVGDKQSNTISVAVVEAKPKPAADAFQHRILLVEHTGNQCPNCPRMIRGLRYLETTEYHDRYNEVTSHTYRSSDPAYSSDAEYVTGLYNISGYPNLSYNFRHPVITSATSWDQTTAKRIQGEIDKMWKPLGADAGAKVSVSEVSGGSLTVDIEVMANVANDYRVSAWVLEDDIYGYQSGRDSDEEWMDYHDHCVRSVQAGRRSSYDLTGEDLGHIDVKGTATKQFTIDIDGSWNSANLKVLVIITSPNDEFSGLYEVANTVLCRVGESVDYEYMVTE